jgi:hypothetical protein
VRLEKFIKDYPDFRISTELEVCDKDRYVVKAYLYNGYSCPLSGHAGTEGKCEMLWYEVNNVGKWQPQKAWA